jgi:hypothetical protein
MKKIIPKLSRFERHPDTQKIVDYIRHMSVVDLRDVARLIGCDPSDRNQDIWRAYLHSARRILEHEKIVFHAGVHLGDGEQWKLYRMTDGAKVSQVATDKLRWAERANRRVVRVLRATSYRNLSSLEQRQFVEIAALATFRYRGRIDQLCAIESKVDRDAQLKRIAKRESSAIGAAIELAAKAEGQ